MVHTIANAKSFGNSNLYIDKCYNPNQHAGMTNADRRLKKLKNLIQQFDSVADFARKYDLNEIYIRHLLSGLRTFGEKSAANMGKKIAGDSNYFDDAILAETMADYAPSPPLTQRQRQIVDLMENLTEQQQVTIIEQAQTQVQQNQQIINQLSTMRKTPNSKST